MNLKRLAIIVLSVLLLLLCTGGALYTWRDKTSIDPAINLSPPTVDQKTATNNKGRFENQAAAPQDTATPIQITNAYQDDNIGKIVVQTILPGTGWKTCTLVLKNGDEKITKQAKALYQPTDSICMGFSVERAEFRSTGQWAAELSADNLNGSTSHVSSTFEIR